MITSKINLLIPVKALLVTSLLASLAQAGSSTGAVTGLEIQDQGNAATVFFAAGPHASKPGCATRDEWAFQSATENGKAMLAILLTAQSQGKSVAVSGTNGCSYWGDREDPQRIKIVD